MTAAEVLYAWAEPSSRGVTTYQVQLFQNGEMSCDCPAWCFARRGQPRTCRHVRDHSNEAVAIMVEFRSGRPIPQRQQVPSVVPLKRAVGDGLVDNYISTLEL